VYNCGPTSTLLLPSLSVITTKLFFLLIKNRWLFIILSLLRTLLSKKGKKILEQCTNSVRRQPIPNPFDPFDLDDFKPEREEKPFSFMQVTIATRVWHIAKDAMFWASVGGASGITLATLSLVALASKAAPANTEATANTETPNSTSRSVVSGVAGMALLQAGTLGAVVGGSVGALISTYKDHRVCIQLRTDCVQIDNQLGIDSIKKANYIFQEYAKKTKEKNEDKKVHSRKGSAQMTDLSGKTS